jgi:hypothetical protein
MAITLQVDDGEYSTNIKTGARHTGFTIIVVDADSVCGKRDRTWQRVQAQQTVQLHGFAIPTKTQSKALVWCAAVYRFAAIASIYPAETAGPCLFRVFLVTYPPQPNQPNRLGEFKTLGDLYQLPGDISGDSSQPVGTPDPSPLGTLAIYFTPVLACCNVSALTC